MRILIVGTGEAGQYLARMLCALQHDVVLIDEQAQPLEAAEAQLDVLTVRGNGAHPDVLARADVQKADMVLAVTNSDEVNLLACAYARAYGVSFKVARVSNSVYSTFRNPLDIRTIGPDHVICHKEETARAMAGILSRPGAREVFGLFDGRLQAIGVPVSKSSPLIGCSLKDCPDESRLSSLRFVALMRDGKLIIPRGDTTVQVHDELYAVLKPDEADQFMDWACPDRPVLTRVIIAGGGDIGFHLAQLLESQEMDVVMIEEDADRADVCSGLLQRSLVLHGSCLDKETLNEAGLGNQSALVACSGDDENNIITCLLAEKMGVAFTLARVSNLEYVPVIDGLSLVNRIVSPQQAMVNAVLHYVRGRNVKAARLFHKLPGELLEVVIPEKSHLAGKKIRSVKIPRETIIAAILRGEDVVVPTGEVELLVGDDLVLYTTSQDMKKLRSFFEQ